MKLFSERTLYIPCKSFIDVLTYMSKVIAIFLGYTFGVSSCVQIYILQNVSHHVTFPCREVYNSIEH